MVTEAKLEKLESMCRASISWCSQPLWSGAEGVAKISACGEFFHKMCYPASPLPMASHGTMRWHSFFLIVNYSITDYTSDVIIPPCQMLSFGGIMVKIECEHWITALVFLYLSTIQWWHNDFWTTMYQLDIKKLRNTFHPSLWCIREQIIYLSFCCKSCMMKKDDALPDFAGYEI